jgi:hypothetical protein
MNTKTRDLIEKVYDIFDETCSNEEYNDAKWWQLYYVSVEAKVRELIAAVEEDE